jgi:hypothetical protein
MTSITISQAPALPTGPPFSHDAPPKRSTPTSSRTNLDLSVVVCIKYLL